MPKDGSNSYGEEQLAALLKRAAQLQQEAGDPDTQLNLAQIEQIAREVGIDPLFVRQAASELSSQAGTDSGQPFLGGPTACTLQQSVAGVLVGEDFEPLLEEIRHTLNDTGHLGSGAGHPPGWRFEFRFFNWGGMSFESGRRRAAERSLVWHSSIALSGRDICVRIYSQNGTTTVRVEEQFTSLAGSLYVGLAGGLGLGLAVLSFTFGIAFFDALLPSLLLAALSLGGCYLLARTLYRSNVRRRRQQLQQLFGRLLQQVRQTLNIA